MARIKMAYIGGGSTRAPGTMASIIHQGENFQGSEIVLIDLVPDRLAVVKELATKMARDRGLDLTITTTTDCRAGLVDCDAVLTSFRPGGFEARYQDESIPLRNGVIGQETQGPGGFFMALRSIHAMQGIIADIEAVCPGARLFNYTNPINLVSEAITHHSDIPTVSLCEGPIIFPRHLAEVADLDPDRVDAVMIGLNHGCWSVRHRYDGEDMMPLLQAAYERKQHDPAASKHALRQLAMATTMQSIPASYSSTTILRMKSWPSCRPSPLRAPRTSWRRYRTTGRITGSRLPPIILSWIRLARGAASMSWSWLSTSWTRYLTTGRRSGR
jgi:6-phospho-beta-glucosidase